MTKQKIGLVDLNENTCRWPIGDPKHKDFHFCGCKPIAKSSYCEEHDRKAFSPDPLPKIYFTGE